MRWRCSLFAVLCLCIVSETVAADITAKTTTDSVLVAEPFRLEISVHAPEGATVKFPPITENLGEFQVLGAQDVLDVPGENGRDWTRIITLESITTGEIEIPPVGVQVDAGGTMTQLWTQPITVRVESVIQDFSDPTQFRDIVSVVDVTQPTSPSHSWMWWSMGAGIAGTVFAIAAIILFRRRCALQPREWALGQLEALRSLEHANHNANEMSAQIVCDVVRKYLMLEFGVSESGETAQELVEKLHREGGIDAAKLDSLNGLFSKADQVKFAGMKISTEALHEILHTASAIIKGIGHENGREVG